MISTKSEAISIIEKMPDDSSLDDIIEKLYFKAHVEEGLRQLDDNKNLSHEVVKENISKWIIK